MSMIGGTVQSELANRFYVSQVYDVDSTLTLHAYQLIGDDADVEIVCGDTKVVDSRRTRLITELHFGSQVVVIC